MDAKVFLAFVSGFFVAYSSVAVGGCQSARAPAVVLILNCLMFALGFLTARSLFGEWKLALVGENPLLGLLRSFSGEPGGEGRVRIRRPEEAPRSQPRGKCGSAPRNRRRPLAAGPSGGGGSDDGEGCAGEEVSGEGPEAGAGADEDACRKKDGDGREGDAARLDRNADLDALAGQL